MSFREGVKQKFKQTKSDLKAFFKRKDGSDTGTTRSNTPSSFPPHTGSHVVAGEAGNAGVSVPGTPPPAQAPTSPFVIPPPGDIADADNHLGQPPDPTSLVEEHRRGTIEPSPSAPGISPQVVDTSKAVSTEQVISQLPASECTTTDKALSHIEANTSSSTGQPVSGQILGEATTGKGLEVLTTGIAQSATDVLKFGPLRDISNILQGFAEMYIVEGAVKKEYEALRRRLQALLQVLDEHSDVVISPKMESKTRETREFIGRELNSIGNKPSGESHGRLPTAEEKEDKFLGCCHRMQEYMDHLVLDTSLSMSASISKINEEQSKKNKVEEEQSKEFITSRIGRLLHSSSACYDSAAGAELKRRECAPGTRIDVLANLLRWAKNNCTGGVYWLNGMAGTGKTTIAYSVCMQLDTKRELAASFFCSRLLDECRNVNMIIPSIAYQLAQISHPLQSALSTILDKHPDINTKRLNMQFQMLIQEPLVSVKHTLPEGLVVVIDALDECDNKQSTSDILDVLLSRATDLPIKFIVSSRPEPQIRDQMTEERVNSRLVLHELDTGNVQTDIKTYLQDELKPMKPPPEKAQIAALVDRAGILFIYAATAVRYISYGNFRNGAARLRTLLAESRTEGTKKYKEIDQLYMTILNAALDDQELEENERRDMEQVLHTVICAREPLTVGGLSELLQIKDVYQVRAALAPLWSVLHVVEGKELVTTLHASFPDFMFDPTRSKTYCCNLTIHNRKLAEHCFEQIKRTQPQFNICGLGSSYLPDEKVPNIEEQVANGILPELLYACRFWADHVKAGKCASSVANQLQDFLSMRLLLWMEVLNLGKQMKAGTECLKMMVGWCDQLEEHQELVELVHDAKRFVEAFSSNPVSQSTPHIYVSMLTFWPRAAPITKHYAKYTRGPVQVEGTALDRRQLAHLSTWAFEDETEGMAVSPDGLYVALRIGSDVLVVDSSSGGRLLGPLEVQEGAVRSIAFSPDGTRIFAGSIEGNKATIVGWDTHTGDIVAGPLELKGHTRGIQCLSFSPDCSCVATGSNDNTVCLWSTESGNMLLHLATQDTVHEIVYSPNGTRIAAQIGDASLQVWDSQTGNPILGPLKDPVSIYQIAFSESVDQSCIIYVSDGETIHVRDAQTGDKILGPSKEHTAGIACIGCSPDARYIVSGSYDGTVRLWDAQNGNLVLGPLEAHTSRITSVAFSPDGSRIISACKGGLVCTWDVRQRNLTSSSTNAPFDQITCVKFSSNGTRCVSGSNFGTICIWDAYTGEMAVGPIKAHTSRINTVDFLSDRVVSGSVDGEICVCDALGGEVVLGPLELGSGTIWVVAFSPNGMLVVTGSSRQVDVWDAQNGSRVLGPLTDLKGKVLSLQFSPDGTRIVGSARRPSKNIVVWDVSDGKNLFGTLDGHSDWVGSVSYSPNGALIASGSNDTTMIIWDAYTGKKVLGPFSGHSNYVLSVHFSPDSTRLVSGSDDRTIQIWDVQTGETVFELLNGHENAIRSVEYSPDGTRILSRSDDMSVRIHDARSPEERALSRPESEVGDWTIRKDGWVVDDQGRLLVWVPGDLRKALMWSSMQVMVAPQGYVRLRFDKSRMGESWAKGYTSDL